MQAESKQIHLYMRIPAQSKEIFIRLHQKGFIKILRNAIIHSEKPVLERVITPEQQSIPLLNSSAAPL